jgi:hypothetical protein
MNSRVDWRVTGRAARRLSVGSSRNCVLESASNRAAWPSVALNLRFTEGLSSIMRHFNCKITGADMACWTAFMASIAQLVRAPDCGLCEPC